MSIIYIYLLFLCFQNREFGLKNEIYSLKLLFKAREWDPAEIWITPEPDVNPETWVGISLLVFVPEVPSPICPKLLDPHPKTCPLSIENLV